MHGYVNQYKGGVCVSCGSARPLLNLKKKEKKHKIQSFEPIKVSNLLNLFNF